MRLSKPMRLTTLMVGIVTLSVQAGPAALAQAQPSAMEAAPKASGTLQRADKDMARVLTKLQQLGAQPLGTQTVEQTRQGPSPADAVKAVLKDEGKDPEALMAQMHVKKQDMSYPTDGGSQPVRIYTPETSGAPTAGGMPVIVYFHGGGWVIADIDTYEASAMALARKTKAILVSADYRHAPENKFPAAHQDAFNAYQWVLKNAAQWGGNPAQVAVAGESAGGNLALNVAIMARDNNVARPVHMLLVYPVAGTDTDTPSYRKNADAIPLSRKAMEWFFKNTMESESDRNDPRLDLVGKANLAGLPSATVITDEIDPLMSEGKSLAEKLKQAGSTVKYENYDGVTHEFFGMDAVVKTAAKAQDMAAKELREAFAKPARAAMK